MWTNKIINLWIVTLLLTVFLLGVAPIRIDNVAAITYEENFVPDELIIKFRDDTPLVTSLSLDGFVTTGLTSIDTLNEIYQVTEMQKVFKTHTSGSLSKIYKITLSSNTDVISATTIYEADAHIEYAEPNYIYHTCATIPNDPSFNSQWALHQFSNHDIDAPEAWDIEKGNSDVVIAVIDTGVDWNHPDLSANIWDNTDEIPGNGIDDDLNGYDDDVRGWDFFNNDNNPMDDHWHGTHCSGIIGALTNNTVGVAGVCWNCVIMPVKGLNDFGSGNAVVLSKGIVYAADNGADIISMSWGNNTPSLTMENALDYAYNKGVCLVAAAGNDNTSQKHYPAAYENVIAVAATNQNDERCTEEDWGADHGSNYGEWIDIAAPGNDIISTIFDNSYGWAHGTSMACPHVAGLAGLILSKKPGLPQSAVKLIIQDTADPVDSPGKPIGTGRINAYEALDSLGTPPGSPPPDIECNNCNIFYSIHNSTVDFWAEVEVIWGGGLLGGELHLDIVFFEWDFDYDGTFNVQSTAWRPTYIYTSSGTYTVALRVTAVRVTPLHTYFCECFTTVNITVFALHIANFSTIVYIAPSLAVSLEDTFTVHIGINPGEPIAGVQADIHFDPSLLTVTSVTNGGMFDMWVSNLLEIDNDMGLVRNIVAFDKGNVTESGIFATINVTAKTLDGLSTLNLVNVEIGDPDGNPVALSLYNGSVIITLDDAEPPVSHVNPITPYKSHLKEMPLGITVTATDDESGVKEVSLYYRYSTDNSAWTNWMPYGEDQIKSPYTWQFTAPNGTGYYEFYSQALDNADNLESVAFVADAMCRIYPNVDVNMDERVNILDIVLIGQHWGETGEPCWIAMDVNSDGIVNILDLILVAQHWTG